MTSVCFFSNVYYPQRVTWKTYSSRKLFSILLSSKCRNLTTWITLHQKKILSYFFIFSAPFFYMYRPCRDPSGIKAFLENISKPNSYVQLLHNLFHYIIYFLALTLFLQIWKNIKPYCADCLNFNFRRSHSSLLFQKTGRILGSLQIPWQ